MKIARVVVDFYYNDYADGSKMAERIMDYAEGVICEDAHEDESSPCNLVGGSIYYMTEDQYDALSEETL